MQRGLAAGREIFGGDIISFALGAAASGRDPIGDFFKRLGNSIAHPQHKPPPKTATHKGGKSTTGKPPGPAASPSPGEITNAPAATFSVAFAASRSHGRQRAPFQSAPRCSLRCAGSGPAGFCHQSLRADRRICGRARLSAGNGSEGSIQPQNFPDPVSSARSPSSAQHLDDFRRRISRLRRRGSARFSRHGQAHSLRAVRAA